MERDEAALNQLTEKIIGAAIEVHRTLGPGLLESIYESALAIEMNQRNLPFVRQKPVQVKYKDVFAGDLRIDLIVADAVIVEIKAISGIDRVHEAQLLTYMRLSGCPLGLLINFNVPRLLDGLKRMRL